MRAKQRVAARILVVDDDSGITIRAAMALRAAGYEVLTAASGDEALDLLVREEKTPALIVLDLVMPGMDGWRFREVQKAHSKLWHIPVVVVSDAPIDDEYFGSLEAAALLIKPFERRELLKTVTRAISLPWVKTPVSSSASSDLRPARNPGEAGV
jgi:DNA-binding response OmpR family regulator